MSYLLVVESTILIHLDGFHLSRAFGNELLLTHVNFFVQLPRDPLYLPTFTQKDYHLKLENYKQVML